MEPRVVGVGGLVGDCVVGLGPSDVWPAPSLRYQEVKGELSKKVERS